MMGEKRTAAQLASLTEVYDHRRDRSEELVSGLERRLQEMDSRREDMTLDWNHVHDLGRTVELLVRLHRELDKVGL